MIIFSDYKKSFREDWRLSNYYDGAGNVTNRVFANGKIQLLRWDGMGRLASVIQRDSATNGFNWSALYDAIGRRLRTVNIPVVNGTTNSVMTLTLDSYYDPLVEFQELAVAVNGQRTWKVMGPDMNGSYGGMNGVGGLEATVREIDALTTPVLNDYFGNVLATISGTTVNWNPVRVSGYGAVLGYEAPTLTLSTPLAETLLWRTRRLDPSGFYYMGARYYDPMAGRFLSPDPLGHSASMDLYSFCNGDPLNGFDADGRFGKTTINAVGTVIAGSMNLAESIAKLPVIGLERTILATFGYETHYVPYLAKNLQNGFNSFANYWNLTKGASLLGSLDAILHQVPLIGNFVPGPVGNMDGSPTIVIGGGINANSFQLSLQRDNRTIENLQSYGVSTRMASATYDRGTATDVLFSALLGNTAQGLEYANQVLNVVGSGGTVWADNHSGGVMRDSIGSFYLGLNNVGVARSFSEQGPGIGLYNNIQTLSANYSIGKDAVSDMGAFLSPAYFGQNTHYNWSRSNDSHQQGGSGTGNEFNAARAAFFGK